MHSTEETPQKELILYIVRHAEAGQHGDPRYSDDSLRPVTKDGRKRFRCLVKKMARRGFEPAVIATSPFVRCRQTAEVIAKRGRGKAELVELAELEPLSQLEALLKWTTEQPSGQIAWVGHAPDVSILLGQLIGADPESIGFAKGAIAAIKFSGTIAPGKGHLVWLVTPKAMGC